MTEFYNWKELHHTSLMVKPTGLMLLEEGRIEEVACRLKTEHPPGIYTKCKRRVVFDREYVLERVSRLLSNLDCFDKKILFNELLAQSEAEINKILNENLVKDAE